MNHMASPVDKMTTDLQRQY